MKKNNIKRIAVALALVEALTLMGCASSSNKHNKIISEISSLSESDYTILDERTIMLNDGTILLLTKIYYDPVEVILEDGSVSYEAPSVCNVVIGSGKDMQCYYAVLEPVDDYELKLK